MTATTAPKPWDLSHVLDLVNSLSFQDSHNGASRDDKEQPRELYGSYSEGNKQVEVKDFAKDTSSLGDFDKIFQYLGTPKHEAALPVLASPAPAVQPPVIDTTNTTIFSKTTDYTSDGAAQATVTPRTRRSVRWQDAGEEDDETTAAASDSSIAPESPTLSKSQRKKRNRRERKAKEAAEAAAKAALRAPAVVSESEADFVQRKTPAKKASAHAGVSTPVKQYNLRPRDATGKAVTATTPELRTADSFFEAAKLARESVEQAKVEQSKKTNAEAIKSNKIVPNGAVKATPSKSAVSGAASTTTATPTLALKHGIATQGVNKITTTLSRPALQRPHSTSAAGLQLVPSTVGPDSKTKKLIAAPSNTPSATATQVLLPRPLPEIKPMVVRSGEDRDWALLLKLLNDFPQDRKHLISPMNLTTHNNDPNGIHVFVDASNIFIGFEDQLKRSRGISQWTQIPPVNLSFDALALLIERRRPVAKRVLVGSTPLLPAFEKAKAVGYECSILEKVYKARELTERQIFFREHDRYGVRKRAKAPPANNVASAQQNGSGSGGSGSETSAAPQYAPARMIEQGVDEILHLKILESVVDAEKPGTIVLATGDAAQAEYSQGFMAMAERALKKGWTVELVSWSKNISAMYTRKVWREAWGAQFRVVWLDDYAEELLDI